MTPSDLLARASDLHSRRTPFVLATVVRVERPASARPGDCALVLPDGTLEGFVGGDCAESTVRRHGLRQLAAGQSTLLRITPAGRETGPVTEGVVTACNPCLSGGTLEIFLEVMSPPMLVHVFGESPIARALEALGAAMGWELRRGGRADSPIAPDMAAVVVASHGGDEGRVLTAALRAGIPYVGLVASRRRGGAVLAALDVTAEQRACVHTPAGLDIGANGPAEIAVSIVAEIIASRPSAARPSDAQPSAEPFVLPEAPAEAVDPVCGMTVAAVDGSLQVIHSGTTWYFCGSGCRDAFAADPERYHA